MFSIINGSFVEQEKATINVFDIGLLRGYGVFDYFPFEHFKPLFFEDYLYRFINSCKKLYLDLGITEDQLKEQIIGLIQKNGIEKGAIRLVATGNVSESYFYPKKANLMVLQQSYPVYENRLYDVGLNLVSYEYQRDFPTIKSLNYLAPIQFLTGKNDKSIDDVLYFKEGLISESSRSNFFLITKNDILVTPDEGVLEGVTRKHVIKSAIAKGTKVEIRAVSVHELKEAKACFLTSSTKEIMPIAKIDTQNFESATYLKELVKSFSNYKKEYFQEFDTVK